MNICKRLIEEVYKKVYLIEILIEVKILYEYEDKLEFLKNKYRRYEFELKV